eukprot:1136688-Pelagomonas_calceolata.AAC.13
MKVEKSESHGNGNTLSAPVISCSCSSPAGAGVPPRTCRKGMKRNQRCSRICWLRSRRIYKQPFCEASSSRKASYASGVLNSEGGSQLQQKSEPQ